MCACVCMCVCCLYVCVCVCALRVPSYWLCSDRIISWSSFTAAQLLVCEKVCVQPARAEKGRFSGKALAHPLSVVFFNVLLTPSFFTASHSKVFHKKLHFFVGAALRSGHGTVLERYRGRGHAGMFLFVQNILL